MLGDLQSVLADKQIKLDYDDKTVEYLVNKGFSEKYGARNLRRLIQTDVEDQLAARIIERFFAPFDNVFITVKGDKIEITSK